jgi:transcriptional regulator with XRE-family HTH domain
MVVKKQKDRRGTPKGKRCELSEARLLFMDRLKGLMDAKGDDQKSLAKAEGVGLSQQTISDYLSGAAAPKLESIIPIAKHYDVSCDFLMGVSPAPTKDVDIQELVRKYGLSDVSLKTLSSFVYCKDIMAMRSQDCLDVINALLSGSDVCHKIFELLYTILFVDMGDTTFNTMACKWGELDEKLSLPDLNGDEYRDVLLTVVGRHLEALRKKPTLSMREARLKRLEKIYLPQEPTTTSAPKSAAKKTDKPKSQKKGG